MGEMDDMYGLFEDGEYNPYANDPDDLIFERGQRSELSRRIQRLNETGTGEQLLFDIEEYNSRPAKPERGRVSPKLRCAYVSPREREMLKTRAGGKCERCKREFIEGLGGRGFSVHHDATSIVEYEGRQCGHLRAWCRTCNSLESVGDDAMPQFDSSPLRSAQTTKKAGAP